VASRLKIRKPGPVIVREGLYLTIGPIKKDSALHINDRSTTRLVTVEMVKENNYYYKKLINPAASGAVLDILVTHDKYEAWQYTVELLSSKNTVLIVVQPPKMLDAASALAETIENEVMEYVHTRVLRDP